MSGAADLSIWDVLSSVFAIVFPLWPLVLVGAFRGRGNLLRAALGVWAFLALVRVYLWIASSGVTFAFLIPEPLNTAGFFLAGAVLLALQLGGAFWQQSRLRRRVGAITDVDGLLELPADDFEEMVAELYRGLGHKAKRIGSSGDHGVDIVVQSKDGEKWIVQCKNWRRPVGERVVRDFYGTLQHEKANSGAIFATRGFTRQAREWARGKPFYLYDGNDLLQARQRVHARGARQRSRAF